MDATISRLLNGLKSQSEETRLLAATELRSYVASDLKEAFASNYAEIIEELCFELEGMLSRTDCNEKRGAVIAIGCLAEVDFTGIANYCNQFVDLIHLLTTTGDLQLLVLGSRLLGQFGLLFPNDFVGNQIKLAYEALLRANLSTFEKHFHLLTLRETALHTPTSFYHHVSQCIPAILRYFRDKDVVVRDLAALALRTTLAVAAENEIGRQTQQQALLDMTGADGFGDTTVFPISSCRTLTAAVGGRIISRGGSIAAMRKVSSIQQPVAPYSPTPVLPVNEPPMVWYHNCVVALLYKYNDAWDQRGLVPFSQSYKKMTRDEWAHGSLQVLNELLVCANPEFEKLRSSLDNIVGQPIFHVLIVNQSEGELAVQAVNQAQWAAASAPSGSSTPTSLYSPSKAASTAFLLPLLTSPSHVFGDEAVASELLRQQQFRQQRAVPIVSNACKLMLNANMDKIWPLVLGCVNSKHSGVLHLVLKLLPRLVAFERSVIQSNDNSNADMFVSEHISTRRETLKTSIHTAINFLFDCVNRDRERGFALVTLGLMTYALDGEFERDGYLARLISILLGHLTSTKEASTKKRTGNVQTAVLLTIGLIAKSLGSRACSSLKPLLDPMIARGLSQLMTVTCSFIAEFVPELKRDVQDRLLKRINLILANSSGSHLAPLIHPSVSGSGLVTELSTSNPGPMEHAPVWPVHPPNPVGAGKFSSTTRGVGGRNSVTVAAVTGSQHLRTSSIPLPGFPWSDSFSRTFGPETDVSGDLPNDCQLLTVALKTLRCFDFEGHTLAYFVKHTAENFISISTCAVKEIRLEGVRTCLRLMLPWIKATNIVPASFCKTLDTVSDILGKLLTVGISDPDPDVRMCVFSSLDSQFDNYLAQSSHLNSLFIALNDEVFAIRGLVTQCLGRLSAINPACVQPSLRQFLLKTITNLSDSGTARNREEATALVAILAASAPHFITPYAESLLHAIIPHIRNALPINLRLRLLGLRNERLQMAANVESRGPIGLNGDILTDSTETSFSTALLASKTAAYAAVQTVQAVATVATRNAGDARPGYGRPTVSGSGPVASGSKAAASDMRSRVVTTAEHAAETATVASKVIAAAVRNRGRPSVYTDQLHSLGLVGRNSTLSITPGLDLLIGDADETLDGSNQDFISAAAVLSGGCFGIEGDGAGGASDAPLGLFSRLPGPRPLEGFLASTTKATGLDGAFEEKKLLGAVSAGLRKGERGRLHISALGVNAMWREPRNLVVTLFSALAHLSSVCPDVVVPLMDDLILILAYMLQDTTCHAKRAVAAWAMGVLISNTGYVVLPYVRHPDLLNLFFSLLKQVESKNIQAEILRVLGLIGAVDPFKLKMATGQYDFIQETDIAVSQYDVGESREVDLSHSELLVNLCWDNREEFFASYALAGLMNVLREPLMRNRWDRVVQAIVYVMDSFGQRAIPCLQQVMGGLFRCLHSLREVRLQESILFSTSAIVQIIGPFTKEFAADLVSVIVSYWNNEISPTVQRNCIRLTSVTASVLQADFRPYIPRLVPCILRSLKQDNIDENLIALCDLLGELGSLLYDHVHIIIPALVCLVGNTDEPSLEQLLRTAVDTHNAPRTHNLPSNVSTTAQSISNVTPPPASATGSVARGADAAALVAAAGSSPEAVEVMAAGSSAASPLTQTPRDLETLTLPASPIDSISLEVGIARPRGGHKASNSSGSSGVVGSLRLRLAALRSLLRFTEVLHLESMVTAILHPICRLLMTLHERVQAEDVGKSGKPTSTGAQLALQTLFPPCMDVVANLVVNIGSGFNLILPLIQVTLSTVNISHPRFNAMLSQVTTSGFAALNLGSMERPNLQDTHANCTRKMDEKSTKTHALESMNLQRAWRSSQPVSDDEWSKWLKMLSNALLNESPSPAIRACACLTAVAPAIAQRLFNAAFMSCWKELRDDEQDELINKLEAALRFTTVGGQSGAGISQVVLNLEEFMAHVDKFASSAPRVHLPLSLNLLADRAMRSRAFAKALRYKELEFLDEIEKRSTPSLPTLASLLAIYDKLQLTEASNGVLLYATKNPRAKLTDEEMWYEKLHNWDRALSLCDRKLEDERIRDKTKPILCRMRCLHALGQWPQLENMAWDRWKNLPASARQQVAPLATSAAITIGSWDRARHFTRAFPPGAYEGGFYRAVLALHDGDYATALDEVAKSRAVLAANITPLTADDYQRAYPDLVGAQLLSEVEEVIQYKLIPDRRPILHDAWHYRLLGCQSVVEDWGRVIQLRRLVLDPQENIRSCLRYAGLCRRSGRLSLSLQVILNMIPSNPADVPWEEPIEAPDPSITFSYTKLLWASGAKEEAVKRLQVLREFVIEPLLLEQSARLETTSHDPGKQPSDVAKNIGVITAHIEDLRKLMSKCSLRLGNWYSELFVRPSSDLRGESGLPSDLQTATRVLPNILLPSGHSSSTQQTAYSLNGVASFRTAGLSNSANGIHQKATSSGLQFIDEEAVMGHNFVIHCYCIATEHNPGNRFAWQAWAMANYDLFTRLGVEKAQIEQKESEIRKSLISVTDSGSTANGDHNQPGTTNGTNIKRQNPAADPNDNVLHQALTSLAQRRCVIQRSIEQLAAPSVRGYINSISISSEANLQDSLRLINLLFQFGHIQEIRDVVREGLGKIRLQNWLSVLQQLLARIDTPHEHVANIIVDLLVAVGRQFPQALIYSLVLAFKSGGSDWRRYYATKILYSMEEHSPRLVAEAFLFNEELIRLSVTWMEMWFECLEDASRVYFGEKDTGKMFRLLHPLHLVMETTHQTINEAAFLQEFGKELANSRVFCERFEHQGLRADLQQAWEGYYTTYRTLSKRMANLTSLDLAVAAPRLHEYGKDWVLAVPGSYKPQLPLVRLAEIKNSLTVMTSKQHPRKCTMTGSNGKTYVFLLKGHEDTRQDERVMQFFGLVNTLLMTNPETLRRNLTIQRFSIIPLSTNTGLIGWVPKSDTLHTLIREYREKSDIILNQEHREMLNLAPDFDRLNLSQKMEVFEAGLCVSSGRDLANILWLKSHNSETWYERRTTFIRSIAVMSMVGYILGLGDRHPSNLMLCRDTGKIVHIDFGDCFEVAMMREKYPEKVPFRLTRMIIAAMEVTGIDGVFRHTCETVMQLMRDNRDSLLAVLEAFIHDPLLQWVLLENKRSVFAPPTSATSATAVANSRHGAQNRVPANQHAQQQQQPHLQAPAHPHQVGAAAASAAATTSAPNRPSSRGLPCVFTDHDYPGSPSLRDYRHINPWRHHLCNGPWLGAYETAKAMRRHTESGTIVCERIGLQGFIFSAKPTRTEDFHEDSQSTAFGNTRARDVLNRIRRKLDCNENGLETVVSQQVDDLIREATSSRNVSQMYIGWCAFW